MLGLEGLAARRGLEGHNMDGGEGHQAAACTRRRKEGRRQGHGAEERRRR